MGSHTDLDTESLIARLTLEDKVRLLTGSSMWEMHPSPGVGLAPIRMSDGPVGVRGLQWDERDPSLNLPNPASVAATWDEGMAALAGRALGAEARRKGVNVLLAPTIGLHRSPLGGRNFESWSEDPYLTARLAVAFAHGVQSQGVAATAKHFAFNDTDADRMEYDAVIDEDVRQELYLRPFQDMVDAGVWAVMSSYNRVDGIWVSDHRGLTWDLLKAQWGFDGFVMSDWFANRSVVASARSGLDVSMPGPVSPWTTGLLDAIRSGEVPEAEIDEKVRRVLLLAQRTGAIDGAPPLPDPRPIRQEELVDLAARSMVLLRNEGALPLASDVRLLVIGESAIDVATQGGGSAHVEPETVSQPLDALAATFPGVRFAHGPRVKRIPRRIPLSAARDPESGEPGFRLEYLSASGAVVSSEHRRSSDIASLGDWEHGHVSVRLRFRLAVEIDGIHEIVVFGRGDFALAVDGETLAQGTIELDDVDLIEGLVRPPHRSVTVPLRVGAVDISLAFAPSAVDVVPIARFGLAMRPPLTDDDALIAEAVAAASEAEVVLIVAGTTDDVESEGFDREDIRLPGRQDEVIRAVAAVNPRTIVAVNAGSVYELPWADDVAAILWMGFPGEVAGQALAEVIAGEREPWGRLTTTFVAELEHAAVPATRPVAGQVVYAERDAFGHRAVGVGRHRGGAPEPRFPFGHGLGYSTWELVDVRRTLMDGGEHVVASLRNTGPRPGREVIQVYLVPPVDAVSGAAQLPRLVGFAAASADPGESVEVIVPIDDRAAGTWDAAQDRWVPLRGGTLVVGRSSLDPAALELSRD
jgi:beta-glucosidase